MVEERTTVLRGYGYEFTEVDEPAREMVATLCDAGLPPKLAMLSLARSMVIIGGPRDMLDIACRMIDDLAELRQPEDAELTESLVVSELDIENELE